MNQLMFRRLAKSLNGKPITQTTHGTEVTVLSLDVTKAIGGNDYKGTVIQHGVKKYRVGKRVTGQMHTVTDEYGNRQRFNITTWALGDCIPTGGYL